MMKNKTCCFIGHREINETEELKVKLKNIIENLIINEGVEIFLFGSKSRFNSLCLETVTKLKEKHPEIKRVYVRAEYPYIEEWYESYLLQNYDFTYFPKRAIGANRAVYIRRNLEMINQSKFCVFYYIESFAPKGRTSGTKKAFEYALKKKKEIIKLP